MIDVCEHYVTEFDILFTGSKSKLLFFLKVDMLVPLLQVLKGIATYFCKNIYYG